MIMCQLILDDCIYKYYHYYWYMIFNDVLNTFLSIAITSIENPLSNGTRRLHMSLYDLHTSQITSDPLHFLLLDISRWLPWHRVGGCWGGSPAGATGPWSPRWWRCHHWPSRPQRETWTACWCVWSPLGQHSHHCSLQHTNRCYQ